MNCIKCKCSVFDKALHRTNPIGQEGGYMCMACIEKYEPELAKNIKSDPNFQVIKDIAKAVNNRI